MRALTIWQPWASLLVGGAKPYEFRGWRPPRAVVGQRIVLHAAARKIHKQEVIDLFTALRDREKSEEHALAAAETCLLAEPALRILERAWSPGDEAPLPMSAGIGTAIVGEPRSGVEIAEEFGLPRVNDSDRDQHANWGWPMLDIERWDTPIPMRGKQGLWNWPTPEQLAGDL